MTSSSHIYSISHHIIQFVQLTKTFVVETSCCVVNLLCHLLKKVCLFEHTHHKLTYTHTLYRLEIALPMLYQCSTLPNAPPLPILHPSQWSTPPNAPPSQFSTLPNALSPSNAPLPQTKRKRKKKKKYKRKWKLEMLHPTNADLLVHALFVCQLRRDVMHLKCYSICRQA